MEVNDVETNQRSKQSNPALDSGAGRRRFRSEAGSAPAPIFRLYLGGSLWDCRADYRQNYSQNYSQTTGKPLDGGILRAQPRLWPSSRYPVDFDV